MLYCRREGNRLETRVMASNSETTATRALILPDEAATVRLAEILAEILTRGDVLALTGRPWRGQDRPLRAP